MNDPAAFLHLWHKVWPDRPRTLEELETDLRDLAEPLRPKLWLESDGYAEAQRVVGGTGAWTLEIGVLPEARGKGRGRALYEAAMAHIDPNDEVFVRIDETDAPSLAFAARRGFVERKRDFESSLDTQAVDPGLLESWARTDVEIVPMQSLDTPDFRRAFHALFERVRIDIPRAVPPTPMAFEFFDAYVLGEPTFCWEGSFVARDEGCLIGMCAVYRPEPRKLDQWLTAVLRERRGQSIAKALKARAIQWARENGIREIRTDNDSRNAPMLAINDRLGFVRGLTLVSLSKKR